LKTLGEKKFLLWLDRVGDVMSLRALGDVFGVSFRQLRRARSTRKYRPRMKQREIIYRVTKRAIRVDDWKKRC